MRENRPVLANCLDRIAESLQAEFPSIGTDVAIDATDLAAFANGQQFIRTGGPKREKFSDPDASWGHRSAVSTRNSGSFYGYKLHLAACARTGLPLAWQIETARRNESLYSAPLLDALHARGYRPATVAMDKGYDVTRVHDECEERGCAPVIPIKRPRGNERVLSKREYHRLSPRIPRDSQRFRDLYRGRAAVEREFGRLKHDYGLAPLRVRGLAKVALHADLTMLARLAQALARARPIALAA